MKKQFLILLTTLFCVVPAYAWDFKVDGVLYSVLQWPTEESPGRVSVAQGSSAYNYSGDIVIPVEIVVEDKIYKVENIGRNAFLGCSSVTSITIPSSVTVSHSAFDGCTSLNAVRVVIVDYAEFCNKRCLGEAFWSFTPIQLIDNDGEEITEFIVPDGVTSIGESVFLGCSNLSSIIIPNSVTTIGAGAFMNCSGLMSISIPNSVTTIEGGAFYDCTSLSSVTIPNSVTTIGGSAFSGCTSLSSVTIPNSVTTIGEYTFAGCTSLSSIIIPSSVTTIGQRAFSSCTSLSSIIIPSSVTTIGQRAFDYCTSLSSIIIPSSLTTISDDSFFDCSNLHDVKVVVTDYSEFCNNRIVHKVVELLRYPPIELIDNDGNEIKDYIIPEGVTSIGEYAFQDCSNLSSITIPSSVTTICDYAFQGCWGLKMITSEMPVPSAVNAFNYFDAILVVPQGSRANYKNVSGWDFAFIYEEGETIYDSEQTDEQGLYYTLRQTGASSVYYAVTGHSDEMNAEIVIPANIDGCPVKSIENSVFNGCSGLISAKLSNQLETIGKDAFRGCTSLSSITIPNSVTTIGDRAFEDCSNITSVKLGRNVRSIGDGAFNVCTSLTSITLPDMLESIGFNAFGGCSLTSISIPGSVKSIGGSAFQQCGSLASVVFEEGLTSIESRAFYKCALTSITIPNSVTNIGKEAFRENRQLTTVILGDGITEIADQTFEKCWGLTSVTIPNEVTNIGNYAFRDCFALTSIKLPESLTTMGNGVFPSLISIELPNSFTVIPENLFLDNDFQYIKLGNNVKSIGKNAFGSREPVIEIATSTPPTIDKDAFPNVEYLSDLNVIVPNAAAETAYKKAAVWQDMTFANQNNISEVTVETPGDLSWELVLQCNMTPAKVVGLKVNGTINADDFMQMLVNMKSLLRLDLSDCNIISIPDGALSGKAQLRELTLPSTLQTIGERAFQSCTFLTELTMNNGLQTIGNNAFQGCTYLTGELSLPSSVTTIGASAFVGTDYSSVKLPSSLKTIGDEAFYGLPIAQRLVLPGRITSVGANAFAGTKISGLTIPDGVKSIGDGAFANTPIQGHVTIPDGVTYLGNGAFRNSQLSTVFLPNSITTISEGLFQGCPNLDLLYVPDNFTEIANNAFDGCGALMTIRLSANTESMGEYALQSTPLEYIKVPSKVKVLSRGVLKNSKNLESLTLPANMKLLEGEALYGCTNLRNMSVEALTPPVIRDRSAIRGINTDKCLISIPTQSYRNYVLAEYWGQFVQMRNDIAVETAGNGEIAFESVEEEEDEDVEVKEYNGLPSSARRATRHAPQLATDEESMTFANNGSSVYVPQQGQVRFYIIPAEGEEILSATLDGEDIMPYIVDGVYVATADKKNAKLVVVFSGEGQSSVVQAGDVNGDGDVDIADAVCIVNHVVGKATPTFVPEAADVNGDGDVDIADAVRIVNLVVGKIQSLVRPLNFNLFDPQ